MASRTVAAVCDVSIGFGSPQITILTRSLADYYGADAVVFEPDDSSGLPARDLSPNYRVYRIALSAHPHSRIGRIEYISEVARHLNRMRPEVVVVFCTYCLPVVLKLKYRPKLTIYNSIESIVVYGEFDVELNRYAAHHIDLVLFPEENRARLDISRSPLGTVPVAIVYNCVNSISTINEVISPDQRLRRILYSGTIEVGRTYAEYFTRAEVRALPIDLFGTIAGNASAMLQGPLLGSGGGICLRGRVPADTLGHLRKTYAYSIVMWAPTNENQLYAAPNKFFEAIADGVPPITAPHPQTKMLIDRYQCGIVMDDWSFEAFRSAVDRALALFGTSEYARMVDNCRKAVVQELNWEKQFAKLKRLLPKEL